MNDRNERREKMYMKIIDIIIGLTILVVVLLCIKRSISFQF
jgi:hypothetical protein